MQLLKKRPPHDFWPQFFILTGCMKCNNVILLRYWRSNPNRNFGTKNHFFASKFIAKNLSKQSSIAPNGICLFVHSVFLFVKNTRQRLTDAVFVVAQNGSMRHFAKYRAFQQSLTVYTKTIITSNQSIAQVHDFTSGFNLQQMFAPMAPTHGYDLLHKWV